MDKLQISFMELGDVAAAAKVLSLAMLNNPLHIAVFRGTGEDERQEIERMFVDLFNTLPGIVFLAKEGPNIVGVMRMKSCTGRKAAEAPPAPQDEIDITVRKTVWLNEWARRDPKAQHWHLGPIGVLPSHRRVGIGSKLMQRFCREVDRCAATAYLETDLDENVRFYKKFGFDLLTTSNIFEVENRYMVRPPVK